MRKPGRRFMKVSTIVLAAAAVGLGFTASADPYKDLATQGYRWVAVDGPYACPSKDDLRIQFLRPKATGRMAFSAALVLNSKIG
jgi:hypothetical protein